jgi:hypothetical protein
LVDYEVSKTIEDDINFINPNIEGKRKIIWKIDVFSVWIKIAKKKIKFDYRLYKLIFIMSKFPFRENNNI